MQIEGIPDGWELVRVGKPVANVDWVVWIDGTPKLYQYSQQLTASNWPIIRKVEKPKRYRPFANAAEAEVMWDAKLQFKGHDVDRFRVTAIRATGVIVGASWYSYEEAFERFECIDGTPFGVEVTE